jgi:hypothetical protein
VSSIHWGQWQADTSVRARFTWRLAPAQKRYISCVAALVRAWAADNDGCHGSSPRCNNQISRIVANIDSDGSLRIEMRLDVEEISAVQSS